MYSSVGTGFTFSFRYLILIITTSFLKIFQNQIITGSDLVKKIRILKKVTILVISEISKNWLFSGKN
jgi:hypothetical protein